MRRGYRAIEYDIMLARDGVPVVMHDPYLGRTVAGSGNVFDYDALELATMDAGGWFGARISRASRCRCSSNSRSFARRTGLDEHGNQAGAGLRHRNRRHGGARRRRACSPTKSRPATWPRCRCCPRSATLALASAREVAPQVPRACLMSELPPDWERRRANRWRRSPSTPTTST
jgi:glycerophosphoryl diester phosphodiesterase